MQNRTGGCRLLVVGCWLSVVGFGLLVIGCWLLVVGYWLLGIGCWLDCTILPTTHDQQPTTNIINPNREQKKEGL